MNFRFWIIISLYSCLALNTAGQATVDRIFKPQEDSLRIYMKRIERAKNDSIKLLENSRVLRLLTEILEDDRSFDYAFDTLPYLGIIKSPDNLVKIYNWNLFYKDKSYEYFGFVQYYLKSKEKYIVYPLIDKSSEIPDPEKAILSNTSWYGALYYKIIVNTHKGKTIYTLFGWDGNNEFTNKKIIEILTFANNGKPRFGASVFVIDNDKKKKRILFEFSSRVSMKLHYDEKLGMIVFDHLSPSSSRYIGQYLYYGPDFSYDAFVFTKGKWLYKPIVDVKNPKPINQKKNIK